MNSIKVEECWSTRPGSQRRKCSQHGTEEEFSWTLSCGCHPTSSGSLAESKAYKERRLWPEYVTGSRRGCCSITEQGGTQLALLVFCWPSIVTNEKIYSSHGPIRTWWPGGLGLGHFTRYASESGTRAIHKNGESKGRGWWGFRSVAAIKIVIHLTNLQLLSFPRKWDKPESSDSCPRKSEITKRSNWIRVDSSDIPMHYP